VELTTAGLFVLFAWEFGLRPALLGYAAAAAGLVALSVIDLHTQRLPREVSYTTAAVALPLLAIDAIATDELRRVVMMVLGALIAVAFLGGLRILTRGEGMGDGDVRLAPLLGGLLGWRALPLVGAGMFIAFFLGSVIGLALKGLSKEGRRSAIPFGPFLAIGTVSALFLGDYLVDVVWQT
jgi:leader peptidase (prepilin peptidase)/N-methyltransferase